MNAEALMEAVKSAKGDAEKKLAEMTEDQKKDLVQKIVPQLAVSAKTLGGLIFDCVDNGKVIDKSTGEGKMAMDLAAFVGGLATSVQKILGFDEKKALHEFSTMFGVTIVMNELCKEKKE